MAKPPRLQWYWPIRGSGEQALSLVLVDLNQDGITRSAVETIDPTRGHAEINFDNADASLLGTEGEGWDMLKRVEAGAAVLMAFEQVGGTEAALNMAKDYSLDRYAFGRQIGSYQTIKHRLADMYVKLELARSNAYYGAMILSKTAPSLNWQPQHAFLRQRPINLPRRNAFRCMAASAFLGSQSAVSLSASKLRHWLWAVPADGKTGSYQSLRKVTWLDAPCHWHEEMIIRRTVKWI